MAFENTIKRIDHREWSLLKDKWLSYIPSFNFPGEAPAHQTMEFVGLQNIYQYANNAAEYKTDVPLLRQAILREAIYFVHKATHVCGTANIHIDNGSMSWAMSSAYQSSYFALKGILALLGLSFPRINQGLMIDCFPEEEKLSNKQRKNGIKPKSELKFIVMPKLSHTQMWQIFQRVLHVSEIQIWKKELVIFLRRLNVEEFANQRNSLHYKNNFWIFPEDLYKRIYDPLFGVDEDLFNNISIDYVKRKDFSFLLNCILLKLAIDLVKNLGENATSIIDEYNIILQTLKEGIHGRFLACVNFP